MGFKLKSLIDPFNLTGIHKGKGPDGIKQPEYYTDPDYRETQDYLKKFGMGILDGNINDYYKPIGEMGGSQFESMLGLTTRDIHKNALEAGAKSGRARGGSLQASTAGAIADAAVKARYSDYGRALEGRRSLLNTGLDVTTGVRSAGQLEGARRNDFNWKDYDAKLTERNYQEQLRKERDEALGKMIGTIASVGLGVATGGMSFGLQGAMAGGLDAFTGGGTNFLGNLTKNKQSVAGVSSLGGIDDGVDFS